MLRKGRYTGGMKNMLQLSVLILPALLLIDLLWIGVVAQGIYQAQIGYLLADGVVWWAAVLLYVIYALALAYFAVIPALRKQSIMLALYNGLFLGLVVFAVYGLTNLATLRDWPLAITFIDMAFGTIVAGVVSTFAYLFGRGFVRV